MIASDLNKRRKLLRLICRSLSISKQRPGFTTERNLIICQVQATESLKASTRLRGVFTEILNPEKTRGGTECAGYRDLRILFIPGRVVPALASQSLQIIRGEFDDFYVKANNLVNVNVSRFFKTFESYADARACAISWVRNCLFEIGDLESAEPEEREALPVGLDFPPWRARIALRWLADKDRRALVGNTDNEDEQE